MSIMNTPQRNPLDGAKFREQYISNLRLQASNNQKNQNANQIFKNTGQTPSRPPDSRTTTERVADLEGAKVDLRSKLGTITDGVIASQIIGELSPEQIRFAIDKWLIIEGDMKKQFSTGVPTSAFIAYLNRLIQKFQQTEGVEMGLQQSAGDAIIMSNTQILYGLPREQIWSVLKSSLDKVSRQFGINTTQLMTLIDENESIIPSQEEINTIQSLPDNIKAEIGILFNDVLRNLPANNIMASLIGEINLGMANRDKRYTEEVLNNLVQQITLEPSVMDQMAEIREIVSDFFAEQKGIKNDSQSGAFSSGASSQSVNSPPENISEMIGSIGKSPKKTSIIEEEEGADLYDKQPRVIQIDDWGALGARNKTAKINFLNARLFKNKELILTDEKGKEYGQNITRRGNSYIESKSGVTNARLDALYDSYMTQMQNGLAGEGFTGKMCGSGLSRPNKPYRQSIAHLMDKPVEKPKPYTQFGRYFINKQRLHGEGILAFRQPSGNTIHNLPTEKVSRPLAHVFQTLVGKGIPTYEDIAGLSKEEKKKLANICQKCKVDSPSIPKEHIKAEGQQEEDRFNILRGEIIAGNDSKQIAKEFKVLLLKFVAEDRIPRRQANEILHELLALGH